MNKTGQEIENDIYNFLKSSDLSVIINGSIYKAGMRPKNAVTEDAVVKFVTGLEEQISSGTVVINIFVPNIAYSEETGKVKDITRCTEIEIAANAWVKNTLNAAYSDYLFKLAQTIYTEEEREIDQHFVSIRLSYRYLTD